MKPDRMRYLSEMTAAGTAVAVFVTVYLAALALLGWLPTLLIAWLPASILAWMTARALRGAAQSVFHFNAADRLADLLGDDLLEPVAIQRRAERPRRRI